MKLTGQRIAIWFSCGAASAIAAKLTLDMYGAANDVRISAALLPAQGTREK